MMAEKHLPDTAPVDHKARKTPLNFCQNAGQMCHYFYFKKNKETKDT